LLSPELIGRFVDQPGGTRAVYDGRPGHPVVLGAEQMAALSRLMGDRGARDLLHGGPVIECGHLSSGRDVDTPDDLEAIRISSWVCWWRCSRSSARGAARTPEDSLQARHEAR
jgi:CTP:molybdopterin cytidylyltransferase MocA